MAPQQDLAGGTTPPLEPPDFSLVLGGPVVSALPANASVRGRIGAFASPDCVHPGFRLAAGSSPDCAGIEAISRSWREMSPPISGVVSPRLQYLPVVWQFLVHPCGWHSNARPIRSLVFP